MTKKNLRPQTATPPPVPSVHRTPQDEILHSSPPPMPQRDAETPSFVIQLHDSSGRSKNKESAGWLSSLVLHAALVALFFVLLAPADYGGVDTLKLLVTLSQEEQPLQKVARFVPVAAEDDLSPEDPVEVDAPVSVPPLPESPLAAMSGSGALSRASDDHGQHTGGGNVALSGSFFGVNAEGHDFVYVLDMSGSMRGRRFERATAELVRSVSGLQESQKFYVLLFSNGAVQMFGESKAHPTPIAATAKNKEKLSRWLKNAFEGGGTKPSRALRVALRMKPSAVFMLSDGEFDDQKDSHKPTSNLLGGNSDTFSVVAAEKSETPIHAIAFEDPQSCKNMKRLAEMSGGEYRFAEFRSSNMAKESLAFARQALRRGETATAQILMRELVVTYGQNRVALGDCSPRAPTDPYVRALAHTVPQITALLREEAVNAEHEPE